MPRFFFNLFFVFLTFTFFQTANSLTYNVKSGWKDGTGVWSHDDFIPNVITVVVGDSILWTPLNGVDGLYFLAASAKPGPVVVFDQLDTTVITPPLSDIVWPANSANKNVSGGAFVGSGPIGVIAAPYYDVATASAIPTTATFTFNVSGTFVGYSALNPYATLVVTVAATAPLTDIQVDANTATTITGFAAKISTLTTANNFASTTNNVVVNPDTNFSTYIIQVGFSDPASGLYYSKFWPNNGNPSIHQGDTVRFVPAAYMGLSPARPYPYRAIFFNVSNSFSFLPVHPVVKVAPQTMMNIYLHYPTGNPRNYVSGTLGSGLFSGMTYDATYGWEVIFNNTGTFYYKCGFTQQTGQVTVGAAQRPLLDPFDPWVREYRSFDGHSNNIANPFWGQVNQPYGRDMTQGAADPSFISDPLQTTYNILDAIDATLPNERYVSNQMARASNSGRDYVTNSINVLHTEFSQFMVADMVDTVYNRAQGATGLSHYTPMIDPHDYWINTNDWRTPGLSPGNFTGPYNFVNVDLSPPNNTNVPPTDGRFGLNTLRTQPLTMQYNQIIPVGQPKHSGNAQTPYFDLSPIYGRQMANVQKIWNHSTGELVEVFLPGNFQTTTTFPKNDPDFQLSGDGRINKVPGLRATFDLFIKNHNNLVRTKFGANCSACTNWTPWMRYQEARRLNIAVWQNMVMREYLASTTGTPNKAYTGYNASVKGSVDITFCQSLGRYGHSLVTHIQERLDNELKPCRRGHFSTFETMYNPSRWKFPIDNTTLKIDYTWECSWRGWANQLSAQCDIGVVDDLRNQLFVATYRGGTDLVLTNIARGRDNGIVKYNALRKYLNLTAYTSFSQVSTDPFVVKFLNDTYPGGIDTVDAFVGSLAEDRTLNGAATVGELLAAVLHWQFDNLRVGDRFWFENPTYFTPQETIDIHGIKLRDIILTNYPTIEPSAMPLNSFYVSARQLSSGSTGCNTIFPDVPYINNNLPWTTIDLAPGVYRLNWAIDRAGKKRQGGGTAYFAIQVKTMGWVGLGFRDTPPLLNTMKTADIIWCHLNDTGFGVCEDTFALDVGDLFFAEQQDVTLISYDQNNSLTTVVFSRPILTTDSKYDHPISDNLNIIFAYHPTAHNFTYHGPTRSASVTINFLSDYIGPLQEKPQELWIKIILYIWTSVGILFSLFVIVMVFLKRKYFVFQTPEFCVIICFGSICCYISVILLLPDVLSDGMCWAHLWLFGMGFWLVYGGICLKNLRIFIVFTRAANMKITKITWKDLIPPLLIACILEGVFMACWVAIVTVRPNLSYYTSLIAREYTIYCAGNKWMWLGSVLFRVAVLIISAIIAYLSRHLKKEQNYSKETALAIYTSGIILIVGVPIGFAIPQDPILVLLLKGITICLAMTSVILITFYDALSRIITGKDPRSFQSEGLSSVDGASAVVSGGSSSTRLDANMTMNSTSG